MNVMGWIRTAVCMLPMDLNLRSTTYRPYDVYLMLPVLVLVRKIAVVDKSPDLTRKQISAIDI